MRRVVAGDGVELRIWTAADRDELEAARAVSAADLARWMPGVTADLADLDTYFPAVESAFESGAAFLYAIVVDGEIVGHCSLHAADGEIGYWVRSDRTGAGIATRAVRAIVDEARPEWTSFVLHCDVDNTASRRVATNTGFEHVGTDGRTMEWRA